MRFIRLRNMPLCGILRKRISVVGFNLKPMLTSAYASPPEQGDSCLETEANVSAFGRIYGWVEKHQTQSNLILLLLALVVYSLGTYHVRSFTVDDAFISYRYAENLAAGYGFSWNYDSTPVFGFSNYLLVVMTAAAIHFGIDPLVFSKALNVGAGMVAILLLGLLFREVTEGRHKLYFAVSVIWALLPQGWVHAVSGLETTLFTMLLVLAAYLHTAYLRRKDRLTLYCLTACLTLTILCRYEGALIALGILCHQAYLAFRDGGVRTCHLRGFLALALPLVFLACLLVWNGLYFGQPLPNSFYVKSGKTLTGICISGLSIGIWVMTLAPFVTLMLLRIDHFVRHPASSYLLIAVVVFLLPFAAISQTMNYLGRFYYPVAPLVIVAGACSVVLIGGSLRRAGQANGLLSIALVWLFLSAYPLSSYLDVAEYVARYRTGMEEAHISIGQTLGQFSAHKECTVAVVSDAGAIPYYSRWRAFDFYLNDPDFAKHGFDVESFFGHDPEVAVMTFSSGFSPDTARLLTKDELADHLTSIQTWQERQAILSHQSFEDYSLVTIYRFDADYYLYVFVREDMVGPLGDVVSALKSRSNYWRLKTVTDHD